MDDALEVLIATKLPTEIDAGPLTGSWRRPVPAARTWSRAR
ncbi:hypothetical protein [Streptomyces olivaceus]|nr:hypothetical protein [Streptomyces olivaceus]